MSTVRCQRGFSLLELLIYIAVLAIITLVIANAFIILSRGRGQLEAKVEVNSNLRFALEKIKRDITAAANVTTPANAGDASSTLVLTVGADTVRYELAGEQLTRQLNANPAEAINSDSVKITGLVFTRLENSNNNLNKKKVSLEISLAVAYKADSPDWQFSASKLTTVDLRPDL